MVYYDPFTATETAIKLTEAGVNCLEMRQNGHYFTEPILKLEEIIGKHTLNKGIDPVLDWMFENVAIKQYPDSKVMFDKKESREKIDGMVVLAMCMGGYLRSLAPDEEKSVYLERDFLFM